MVALPDADIRWARGGPYLRMHSGRKFPLYTSPKEMAAQWYVPDIAYHGAGVNRYGGGSRLSIAQHMVVGARMAERFYPGTELLPARFLIHDVTESVLGDVPSPVKSLLPDYKELEDQFQRSVELWTDLSFIGDPLVKEIDNRMWLTEREAVYMHVDNDISEDTARVPLEPFELLLSEFLDDFAPWDDSYAEEQYLIEFRRLLPWMDW